MLRKSSFWLAALGLNVMWAAVLPSRTGMAAAALGVVSSAVFAVVVARRARPGTATNPADGVRSTPLPLLAVFLLPAAAFVRTPTIAFWILDGRAWLVLAWIAVAAAVSLRPAPRHPREGLLATGLFVVWASVFWLTTVSDLGVGRYAVETNRLVYRSCQSDPLLTIFTIWEREPASRHLYLGWRTFEDFENGKAYANHVHPYLFSMYAWVRGVRAMTGAAPHAATNSVPFLYMFVLLASVTVLLARAGLLPERPRAIELAALFAGYGTLVTGWRWWNDLYRFSSDNPYPLLASVLVLLYALLLPAARMRLATIVAVTFVILSPVHTPMLLAALAFLFGQPGGTVRHVLVRNRPLIVLGAITLIAGVVVYLVPWYLIRAHGYVAMGSPLLFRSGLDGDTHYFTNMLQAVIAPCPACCWGRPWSALLFPAFVPLLVFGALLWRGLHAGSIAIGRMLMFLAAPYVFSLLLFPQSVSIHPYMYDHLLLVPAMVAGVVCLLQAAARVRFSGTAAFAAVLLLAGVLLSNLIALAQGLVAMPR